MASCLYFQSAGVDQVTTESGGVNSHSVLEQCQRFGGRVELVTASINRVKSPSDYPDYQPT